MIKWTCFDQENKMSKFSGVLQITDIDDFITPSQVYNDIHKCVCWQLWWNTVLETIFIFTHTFDYLHCFGVLQNIHFFHHHLGGMKSILQNTKAIFMNSSVYNQIFFNFIKIFPFQGMHQTCPSGEKGCHQQRSKDKDWGWWVLFWGDSIRFTKYLISALFPW